MLMPRIEPESLRAGLAALGLRAESIESCPLRENAAAKMVINTWLGQDWLKKRFTSHEFINRRPIGLPTDPFMRQARITQIAELMLNLQHVQGVEHVVTRLAKGQRLADDAAELEGAGRLQAAGIPIKFVERTGVKGADYDVEAMIAGQRVCCEMKGKVADPSVRTVVDTLRGAEKQVPVDTPNVLFLKPPDEWMLTKDGFDAMEEGIAEFFRKSDRYAYVVIHSEEWRTWQREDATGTGAIVTRRTLLRRHPSPAVPFPVSSEKWLDGKKGGWLNIQDVVCGPAFRTTKEQLHAALVAANRVGR